VAIAPDEFRGTISAVEFCRTVAREATGLGWDVDSIPMADGGEGTLSVLGGPNLVTIAPDALGELVEVPWRLTGGEAVIESASVIGLAMLGDPSPGQAIEASSHGLGVVIGQAVERGARRVLITVGGTASTDGGRGALEALAESPGRRRALLDGVELLVACDTELDYSAAARTYGPQKGASPSDVELLTQRLDRWADELVERHGVDPRGLDFSGAGGGLAGGLVAIGAQLVSGSELVAGEVSLRDRLLRSDLVITGEGRLDATSGSGKVVGLVCSIAAEAGLRTVVVAGQIEAGLAAWPEAELRSLAGDFGLGRAMAEAPKCVAQVAREVLGDQC